MAVLSISRYTSSPTRTGIFSPFSESADSSASTKRLYQKQAAKKCLSGWGGETVQTLKKSPSTLLRFKLRMGTVPLC